MGMLNQNHLLQYCMIIHAGDHATWSLAFKRMGKYFACKYSSHLHWLVAWGSVPGWLDYLATAQLP